MMVLFPAPVAPTIATVSPFAAEKEMPLRISSFSMYWPIDLTPFKWGW